jgi:hypothetical protein
LKFDVVLLGGVLEALPCEVVERLVTEASRTRNDGDMRGTASATTAITGVAELDVAAA